MTDLVHPTGGEAYGDIAMFQRNTRSIVRRSFSDLPFWLVKIGVR